MSNLNIRKRSTPQHQVQNQEESEPSITEMTGNTPSLQAATGATARIQTLQLMQPETLVRLPGALVT